MVLEGPASRWVGVQDWVYAFQGSDCPSVQECLEGTAAGSRKANRGRWHDPDSFHYEVFRIILQNEILAAKSHWAVSRSLREAGKWEG